MTWCETQVAWFNDIIKLDAGRLSQGTIPKLVRCTALAQEVKEFDAFAQPPLHHLRAADHLADNGSDLAGAEIETAVEFLDRVEDFAVV
jgi:hypothetical protein